MFRKLYGVQKSPIRSRVKSRCTRRNIPPNEQEDHFAKEKSGSSHFPPVPMVPSSPKLKMMSVLESNNIDIARWQMGRIRGEFSCRSSKKKGCHIRTCEYMSLDAQKSATTLAAAFTKKKN